MQASLEDDSATCSGRQTWVCSVPLDTLESGFVELTFSVDEAVWHSYSTPFIFQFVPEVACDLDGPPQLPDGCTFDMLRDPACNPECNVRHCAHDNRACPTSAVVVDAQFGDDGSNGTDVHPVRSLGRAVRLACTGFSVCLPVHVRPGNYSCSDAGVSIVSKVLSVTAVDPARVAYVGGCAHASSALIVANMTDLTLDGLYIDASLSLVQGSVVHIANSSLLAESSVVVRDSTATLSNAVVGGATLTVDYSPQRLQPLRNAYTVGMSYVHAYGLASYHQCLRVLLYLYQGVSRLYSGESGCVV